VQVSNADTGTLFASGARQLPGGPVQAFTFGNGLFLEQTFDLRYQPWSVSSGPVQLGYTMTPAGDVGAISEPGTPRTYDERLLGTIGLQGPYYNWNRWYLPGAGRTGGGEVLGAGSDCPSRKIQSNVGA
jgi:hypothetical protein